jgi:2'-hydroxyisoflavone reductase
MDSVFDAQRGPKGSTSPQIPGLAAAAHQPRSGYGRTAGDERRVPAHRSTTPYHSSMPTRRDFLKTSAAAGGALWVGGVPGLARIGVVDAAAPMKILIFGGTGFIGPHLVRQAVARGHTVTIFSRGRKDGDLPSVVERLVGDRTINDTIPQGDLGALKGRRFDAVIDDPATDPRWVRQSTELLRDSGSYMFVSSTGVYNPYLTNDLDETKPVRTEPANSTDYGIQKAQSEHEVMQVFGNRGTVVRPGYIVGPGDVTDRFTYWPQRLARGGETLVPGRKTDPSQFIDVRDLTAFMIKLVEEKRYGIYNCAGPRDALTFGEFIAGAMAALKSDARLVWADDYDFLRLNRIGAAIPWIRVDGNNANQMTIRNAKAVAAGLTFRPMADTVRDTLAWWPERLNLLATGTQPRFWITEERELQVLAAWKARGGGE